MKKNKQLDIIIVNYKTPRLVLECVNSVKNDIEVVNKIFIVDSASGDDSVNYLKKHITEKNILIISLKHNNGFSAANNVALRVSDAPYVLLLNSDTLVQEGTLRGMVDVMEKNKQIGIATCKLLNKDHTLQGTGGYFPNLMRVFSWMTIQDLPFVDSLIKPFHPMKEKAGIFSNKYFYAKEQELDWVTGAFMLIRRAVVADVGLMDEDYFMYTEDTDYCYRAKTHGWGIKYIPDYSIIHLGGSSSSRQYSILREFAGVKTFYKKHYSEWKMPVLKLLLKIGSLLRMLVFAILGRKEDSKIYAKAFIQA